MLIYSKLCFFKWSESKEEAIDDQEAGGAGCRDQVEPADRVCRGPANQGGRTEGGVRGGTRRQAEGGWLCQVLGTGVYVI